MLFFPKMYQSDIFHLDYQKLYNQGIRYLFFDLDNTIGLLEQEVADENVEKLFAALMLQFHITIVSNHSSKDRVRKFANSLHCDFYFLAMKPSIRVFRKAKKRYGCKKEEMCMIGDQLITDILAANRFGIYSCFVDAMSKKDLKITSFNRILEGYILKIYEKKKIMKRGEYYG